MSQQQLTVFEQKNIRSVERNGETYFSIIDVIEALTDSPNPNNYWVKLKKRESQLVTLCHSLKMTAADGKNRTTDCADTEGVLRLIQSVPSPKAEPFKLWLASLGRQSLEETENPELGFDRLRDLYQAKGYSEEWIGYRLKAIGIRRQLTDEWKKRGVTEGQEYAVLTAEIAKGTFNLTPSEHGQLKGLNKENLRDHMTNFELIFTALGEEATRALTVRNDAQGFSDNHHFATEGGRMAGDARRNFEKNLGESVVSAQNFLKTGAQTDALKADDTNAPT